MKLEGQAALITGGSRGLGLAIARALGAEGASVACVARSGSELEAAVASLAGSGIRAIAAPADVTKDLEVAAALKAVLERFGRLDMLVLNAGTWQGAPIHETTESQWDLLLELNLKGAFLALRHALPAMIAARRGTVVGIASLGGFVGQPGSAAYAASKWGLRGLLESAALELKPHRVRVSIVAPHNINSAKRDIAPGTKERDQNLEPEEIASLVAWICSAPDHVAVGNATIWPLAAGVSPKLG
jgi:NAD(P)-dependent dehydrogenase (short-subunit alcohol dehydrogenase family)